MLFPLRSFLPRHRRRAGFRSFGAGEVLEIPANDFFRRARIAYLLVKIQEQRIGNLSADHSENRDRIARNAALNDDGVQVF